MSNLIILGISGRKGSGKTTTIKYILGHEDRNDKAYFHLSIVEAFKRFCVDVLGLTDEQVNGTNEDKESTVEHLLWENFPIKQSIQGRTGPMTARNVMEYWATDIVKAACEDTASKALMKQIATLYKSWLDLDETRDMVILIDSVRFPSDVVNIQNSGGRVLRLTRDPYRSTNVCETSLDKGVFDKVLANDNISEDEQRRQLTPWLKEIGVL